MATVTFKLKNSQEGKKATILVDFYISRDIRTTISTKEKVLPAHWVNSRVIKDLNRGEINAHLSRIETGLMQLWRDNKDSSRETIIQMAIQIVQGESAVQKKTVFEGFDKLLKVYDKERDKKTVAKFKTLRDYLLKFDQEVKPLTFESMNFDFYYQFKEFLYRQPNQTFPDSYFHDKGDYWIVSKVKSEHPVGLFDDTVYKHIINLKIFLTFARTLEYPVHPSYSDWKIVSREYEPISLTLDEIESLERVNINEKHIDNGRDYLALECRIGQRISDIKRFDVADYKDGEWSFKQYKGRGTRRTEEKVTVYFEGYCAPALDIFRKHNFKMPPISEQKLNKNIRKACKLAGIDSDMYTERWVGNKCVRFYGKKYEFISTHTGRKTFITVGLQFMEAKLVMNLAGIRSYQTLKKYEGKAEPEVIKQALKKTQDDIRILKKVS